VRQVAGDLLIEHPAIKVEGIDAHVCENVLRLSDASAVANAIQQHFEHLPVRGCTTCAEVIHADTRHPEQFLPARRVNDLAQAELRLHLQYHRVDNTHRSHRYGHRIEHVLGGEAGDPLPSFSDEVILVDFGI